MGHAGKSEALRTTDPLDVLRHSAAYLIALVVMTATLPVSGTVLETVPVVLARSDERISTANAAVTWVRSHGDTLRRALKMAELPHEGNAHDVEWLCEQAVAPALELGLLGRTYTHDSDEGIVVLIPYVEQGTPWRMWAGGVITGFRRIEHTIEVDRDARVERIVDGRRVRTTRRTTRVDREVGQSDLNGPVDADDEPIFAPMLEVLIALDGTVIVYKPAASQADAP